jgi:hypothetical protein
MLTSVDPRAPTAFLTSLTKPFAACFLARSTVLRDLGMTGFWAMEFLGLFYALRRRFPAKSQGYHLQCPAMVVQH